MPTSYDAIDLVWGKRGDYEVGYDGDLADTSRDQIESLIQEVRSVVASEFGDWREHPQRAASLSDFIGEPNSRETGAALERRIKDALVANNVVLSRDLDARAVPISIHEILVILTIRALPTENNSLDATTVKTSIVFNWQERGIFFVDGD